METANWTISKLVQKYNDKEIQLPEMQRKYVWKRDKVRALLDSIYKGYPSGSILLWETDYLPETRESAVSSDIENKLETTLLLLDGQQRLTSLTAVLKGIPIKIRVGSKIKEMPIEVYFNMNHPEITEDYETLEQSPDNNDEDEDEDTEDEENEELDDDRLVFQLKNKKIENKPNWVSVTKLFKEGIGTIIVEKNLDKTNPNYKKFMDRLSDLYNKKENYFYPIEILGKDKSYPEVTDVFVRVNSSGAKLRAADLALAQVTSRWRGSMKLFTDVVAECQSAKFDLDEGTLIKCLVSVSTWQNRFKIINRIPIDKMKSDWERTKKGLHFAINFLKENAKIETSSVLPSPFLLIPIVCLAIKSDYEFSTLLENQVLRWFYAAAMWGRYSRGATETALDEDLSAIKNENNPFDRMMTNILSAAGRLEVTESDIEGKNTKSPFFVMSYVLAKRNNAKDWGSGVTISLQNIGKEFKNEYDHIFPKSKLEPYLLQRYNDTMKVKKLINDIANMAFLSKQQNQYKTNKLPEEYFETIVKERGEDALTAQYITLDNSLWTLSRYEEFLQDRRKRIVKGINDLMKSLENKKS